MTLIAILAAIIIQTNGTPTDNLLNSDHRTSVITPGDSLVQRDALLLSREQREREAENRTVVARESRRGTSYTGKGEVKIVEKDTKYFNCVSYSKAMSGVSTRLGNGARANIQGTTPQVGSVGAEKGIVHAVWIVAVNGDMVTLRESNYLRGYITERTIHQSNFIGFIYN